MSETRRSMRKVAVPTIFSPQTSSSASSSRAPRAPLRATPRGAAKNVAKSSKASIPADYDEFIHRKEFTLFTDHTAILIKKLKIEYCDETTRLDELKEGMDPLYIQRKEKKNETDVYLTDEQVRDFLLRKHEPMVGVRGMTIKDFEEMKEAAEQEPEPRSSPRKRVDEKKKNNDGPSTSGEPPAKTSRRA